MSYVLSPRSTNFHIETADVPVFSLPTTPVISPSALMKRLGLRNDVNWYQYSSVALLAFGIEIAASITSLSLPAIACTSASVMFPFASSAYAFSSSASNAAIFSGLYCPIASPRSINRPRAMAFERVLRKVACVWRASASASLITVYLSSGKSFTNAFFIAFAITTYPKPPR